MHEPTAPILLTGATGYVGGRLLHELEKRGRAVRCMARDPRRLEGRAGPETSVVAGDVFDAESLDRALAGVESAFYLVHSMGSKSSFEERDRTAAQNFAAAARRAGVARIVYLGGLGAAEDELSTHLRSRQEVGEILRTSGATVVELRASVVIGSGSLSFELVRALVERLPVMITPRWVRALAQPIAITDVLAYLVRALDLPGAESRVYEIGGADVVSYGEIMKAYARRRGLRRLMIPVPVLTPRLSSLWLGLVTPLYARVGRKLVESMRHDTIVTDDAALRDFDVRPRGIDEAIDLALRHEDERYAATHWYDALSSGGDVRDWTDTEFGSRRVDSRSRAVPAPPAQAFAPIRRIGGRSGWYFGNWLWSVRGWIDLLVGGVGTRRGRGDGEHPRVGDALDFWRVEAYEPDRRLRLAAEMRLPGRAWLEFEVADDGAGGSLIRQTALFDPKGLFGLAYWYAVYPLHVIMFRGMLDRIARRALHAPPG
jgi:uncharacterized protein YbjT (DUF2867 family)